MMGKNHLGDQRVNGA